MPYSSESVTKVTELYAKKKVAAEVAAEVEKAQLYSAVPDVKKIDNRLSSIGLRIFKESMRGGADLCGRIDNIRVEAEELVSERARLVAAAGFDADMGEPKYECPLCKDTGYDKNGKMCKCLHRALVDAEFKNSGMSGLISKQDFDNFSLDYYIGVDRTKMENNLIRAKAFAAAVAEGQCRNMLFMGTTGLGKTHLSSGIAKSVIESGCSVIYESAQNMFSDFSYERFNKGFGDRTPSKTDKYFECDLLIIDDLGTEVSNQFTSACLYNVINTRIVSEKSMLISTNVRRNELLEQYNERIVSRLIGEFEVCAFVGRDVRGEKLKMNKK